MKLVENAKQAWKWLSVQMMFLAGAVQSAWEMAPADLKSSLDATTVYYITISLLILGMLGRFIKQTPDAIE